MNSDWGYKTKAEAQLEAVHATMYDLQKRIENGQNESLQPQMILKTAKKSVASPK